MTQASNSNKRYPYEPDYAVAPGCTLQETINSLGIDQRELALRAGLSAKHVNQIIMGIVPLTQDTAIRLERVTGVPARMWNNLESQYREQVARLEAGEFLDRDLAWLKGIPTKELISRKVIQETCDPPSLLEEVLRFFGVATVNAWKQGWETPQFAFRKSLSFKGKVGAMATWLRLCETEAQKATCAQFDKAKFRSELQAIRGLTVKGPDVFVPQMLTRCASAGVAVALVPEIKGAPVNGAAKWLTPDKALIGLNLRGKYNDRFWFTFFHEAGHILNDSKKETFIDVEYEDDPREQGANHFAASLLIPSPVDQELPRLTMYKAVDAFARKIGIAPGIVVGRLQREQIIDYSQFNGLKQRLQWADAECLRY
ncbi:MAG: helix-turn-helix domain-containing protein [Planctomycetota bacterium]